MPDRTPNREPARRRRMLIILLPTAIVAAALATLVLSRRAATEVPLQASVPLPADLELLAEPMRPLVRDAAERCRREQSAESYGHLARIYHGNRENELAARCYRIAGARGSADPRDRYLLGLIEEYAGNAVAAIESLRSAIALEPGYGPAHYHLGRSLLDAGEPEAAVAAFERAVAIAPDDASYHAMLGAALRQSDRLERAAEVLRAALELDANNAAAHQQLGLTLQAMGRPDEARPHLQRIRQHHGDVVDDPWLAEVQEHAASLGALLEIASGYIAWGRFDSAVRHLEEVAALYPEHAQVHRLLGQAHMGLGAPQQAADAYLRATRLEPDDPEAHAALATILLDDGQLDMAEGEMRRALAADPRNLYALIVQGAIATRRGDTEHAIAILESVVARRADLASAHLWLGEALAAAGRLEQATAAFERAIELRPGAAEHLRRRLDEIRSAAATAGAAR